MTQYRDNVMHKGIMGEQFEANRLNGGNPFAEELTLKERIVAQINENRVNRVSNSSISLQINDDSRQVANAQ